MKTHYELLGLDSAASPDEVKRAFRREIARYHPDKVQHLGPEFQQIAATRAAELTEAYRILMDPAERQAYDTRLASGTPATTAPSADVPPTTGAARTSQETRPRSEPAAAPIPERFRETRESMSGFVRKATMNRLRAAVEQLAGAADAATPAGFDAAFALKPPRGLFQKSEPAVQVLVRMVDRVDPAAIVEVWPVAVASMRAGPRDGVGCVLLLGLGLAPPRELAAAVAEQRRKSRQAAVPVVVPVDTRDWDALVPPETPSMVRKLLERLKLGG